MIHRFSPSPVGRGLRVPSPRGGGLGWGLSVLALLAIAAPAHSQQIDLSLNVIYNTPSDPNSGGAWQLVGKSTNFGIVSINTFLTGVSTEVIDSAPQGTVNGSDPAGLFVFAAAPGPTYIELALGQAPLLPTGGDEEGLFYGVGTLTNGAPNYPGKPVGSNSIGPAFTSLTGVVNVPWATGDLFGDAAWGTAARLLVGTFAPGMTPDFTLPSGREHLGQVFTSLGTSTVAGNTSDFESTAITMIVRTNLMLENDGDYNNNGIVDAADYTVWRDTLNSNVTPFSGADGSGNGVIDTADYNFWVSRFGAITGSGSALPSPVAGGGSLAVPEPATAALGLLAIAFAAARRVRS